MKTPSIPLPAPDDAPSSDVSPLIDLSFLLLIFFLLTSTLVKRETDLGLNGIGRPDARTPLSEPLRLSLAVGAAGAISLDGDVVAEAGSAHALPELHRRLAEAKDLADVTGAEVLVSVAADDNARHQRLVDVLNALSVHGLRNVALP